MSLGKASILSLIPQAMGKIVAQGGLFNFGNATSVGERKTLNLKPEQCYLGESMAHRYTIFLLSAHQKIVAAPTQTFTTINKSSV